jgi:hypothetical protein
MRLHMRRVHGAARHQCTACDFCGLLPQHLVKHAEAAHNDSESLIVCPICRNGVKAEKYEGEDQDTFQKSLMNVENSL